MRNILGIIVVGMVGCAASQPTVQVQAPMPADDVGWARPVAAELPAEGPAPRVPPRPPSASERLYDYEPGAEYKVDVAVGVPLDVALQPGEVIRHTVGGDRAPLQPGDEQPPWDVREGTSGPAGREQPHVYVTVTKPGLAMGLTVATDRRDYYLALRSVERSRVRVVRWAYPHDPPRAVAKPRLWPDPSQPQRYHVGYAIAARDPATRIDCPGDPRCPVWPESATSVGR